VFFVIISQEARFFFLKKKISAALFAWKHYAEVLAWYCCRAMIVGREDNGRSVTLAWDSTWERNKR